MLLCGLPVNPINNIFSQDWLHAEMFTSRWGLVRFDIGRENKYGVNRLRMRLSWFRLSITILAIPLPLGVLNRLSRSTSDRPPTWFVRVYFPRMCTHWCRAHLAHTFIEMELPVAGPPDGSASGLKYRQVRLRSLIQRAYLYFSIKTCSAQRNSANSFHGWSYAAACFLVARFSYLN